MDSAHLIVGNSRLRRVGAVGFPVWELTNEGEVLARLGRLSWWSIYFGFGVRVEVAGEEPAKLRSYENSGMVNAVLLNGDGQRLSVGSVAVSGYGIHGREFNYLLFPNRRDSLADNDWTLSSTHAELGRLTRSPMTLDALAPVPVEAAIIAFTLLRVGIPGDKKMELPITKWTDG